MTKRCLETVDESRRAFLRTAGACAVGMAVLPVRVAWAKEGGGSKVVALPLTSPELRKVQAVGGYVAVKIPNHKESVLLVRESQTSILAFSPICTHEKKKLVYNAKTKELECTERDSDHGSVFDLTGKPLRGKSKTLADQGKKKDLPYYPTKIETKDGQELLLIKLPA